MEPVLSERVREWKAAWESRDADRVAALYEADATHASGLVPRILPDAGGAELRGRERIRDYAAKALARFAWLRFEIVGVVESGDRTAVEYHRHSNVDGDRPAHVLERIDWNGPRICSVRVFHFAHS